MGFKLTTLVVIGTDCTGSCKSNNHTITTMTVPHLFEDSLYLISFISYICSYDVVFTASADEILEKLKKFDANVIFSAEGFCWPDRSLKV